MSENKKKGWTPWGYPKTGYIITNDFDQKKKYYTPDGKEKEKDE